MIKGNCNTKIMPYKVPRHWLFTPSTYLMDSWEPFVEEIYLPETLTKPGNISLCIYEKGQINYHAKSLGLSSLRYLFRKNIPREHVITGPVVDLRQRNPENLAHAITNHLPLALYITNFLQREGHPRPLLVFPADLSLYIRQIYIALGFELLLTDGEVEGSICEYNLEPWISIRSIRHAIIRESLLDSKFASDLINIGSDFPKKIFISRRGTRCLINEGEVEEFLIKRGYQKIYLEDYSILDQLSMVSLADSIVAIHGAALGALLFRAAFNLCPIKVVELFSPGHMTNVYRVITHQTGGYWVGVRGKLWPEIIRQAYSFPKKIHKYAYKNFEICLVSLEKALVSIEL